MLVNRVTLGERQDHTYNTNVLIKKDTNGAFLSAEIPEVYLTAKVFRSNEKQELIPFKIDPTVVQQQYETDPFTPEETAAYKRVLYSEQGRRIVNKLKNSKLINFESFSNIIKACKNANAEFLLKNRHIRSLLAEPKFKHRRRLDFSVEEQSFNRITLKDLGIDKQEVMSLFKKHRLI